MRDVNTSVAFTNFDLFAMNVEINRDNGMLDYNTLREAFGLERRKTFEEIFPDEKNH